MRTKHTCSDLGRIWRYTEISISGLSHACQEIVLPTLGGCERFEKGRMLRIKVKLFARHHKFFSDTAFSLCFRQLIQELAEYEKSPEGPTITVEELEEDGFGTKPFFNCKVVL